MSQTPSKAKKGIEEQQAKFKQEIVNCLIEYIPIKKGEIENTMGILDPNSDIINASDEIFALFQEQVKEIIKSLPKKRDNFAYPDTPEEIERDSYNQALTDVRKLLEKRLK